MRVRRTVRSGYTLLEVLLAGSIAILILAGLYSALDLQMRVSDESRIMAERTSIVRAVLDRVSRDLRPALGSKPGLDTVEAPLGDLGEEGAADEGAEAAPIEEDLPPPLPTFGAGVIGDANTLTIFMTRVPDVGELLSPRSDSLVTGESRGGDVWQVTYWLASVGGLARSEERYVTSPAVAAQAGPMVDDEFRAVIAPEVVGLRFEYFDGYTWSDMWDGTAPAPDGESAIGPPMAVAVIMDFQFQASEVSGMPPEIRTIRHVIAPGTALSIPPDAVLAGGF